MNTDSKECKHIWKSIDNGSLECQICREAEDTDALILNLQNEILEREAYDDSWTRRVAECQAKNEALMDVIRMLTEKDE